MKKTIALAATSAAALALFVTGCSSDDSPEPASATAAAPAAPSASGSASAASVDGKTLDAKWDTTCAKQGGILALALTDTANGTYGHLAVSATISGDDTVTAVGFAGSKGGDNGLPYALGYGQGAPGGSAKVEKDGNTFKVTGEGIGTPDLTNPTAGPKSAPFSVTFACSTIVGG